MKRPVVLIGGRVPITQVGQRVVALPWARDYAEPPKALREFRGILVAALVCAAIWQFDLTSGQGRLFATGLRNPVGMAYFPGSDVLWTAVNERDGLGELRSLAVRIYNDAMAELQEESGQRLFPQGVLPWWDLDESLAEIHIYFPDPWPRPREQKRRIIRRESVVEMSRVLRDDGRGRAAGTPRASSAQTCRANEGGVAHHRRARPG